MKKAFQATTRCESIKWENRLLMKVSTCCTLEDPIMAIHESCNDSIDFCICGTSTGPFAAISLSFSDTDI